MAAIVFGDQTNARKKVKRRLACGQTVSMTVQDERMLRDAYDYMQGYSRRSQIEAYILQKRQELSAISALLPAGAVPGAATGARATLNPSSPVARLTIAATPVLAAYRKGTETDMSLSAANTKESPELKEYQRVSDELAVLDETLQELLKTDSHISIADIEQLLLTLGIQSQRRVLEHMFYEVDEMCDGVICWDELQLTYLRNVADTTGNEPCSFFRILEFITFDPLHKGVIMEDDVMEVLFIRLGGARLEQELKAIYGNNLRAQGGRGTLLLEEYLAACLRKTGRRALVT